MDNQDKLKRIYARNCMVKRIDKALGNPFLQNNHRLGATRCRYLYGLFPVHGQPEFPEETLVAVAGFSGPRVWYKNNEKIRSYEWVRYASLEGYRIDGGMGKLLKAFIEEANPDDIMSYADASWSDGNVYRRLGFTEEQPKTFPDGKTSLKFRLSLHKETL